MSALVQQTLFPAKPAKFPANPANPDERQGGRPVTSEPADTPDGPVSAPLRLWGGRFESGPAEALARLSVSVQFDWRLAGYDLLAARAHARVLHKAGLLDDAELARMLAALDDLADACRSGR